MISDPDQLYAKRTVWFRRPDFIFVACALLLAIFFFLATGLLKSRLSSRGYVESTSLHEIIIGNSVLRVPRNMIRFETERSALVRDQLRLAVHWPTGAGYSKANSAAFLMPDQDEALLFITLEQKSQNEDMSQRWSSVYALVTEGNPVPLNNGLMKQALRANSGFDGEVLYVEQTTGLPWIARCQSDSTHGQPTCLQDIHVSEELSATVRFRASTLDQWQKIREVVDDTMDAIIIR